MMEVQRFLFNSNKFRQKAACPDCGEETKESKNLDLARDLSPGWFSL